jgi:hypothetical protein
MYRPGYSRAVSHQQESLVVYSVGHIETAMPMSASPGIYACKGAR